MQFDFPDENGRPYKSSGGMMVWNEQLKREIPQGWNVETIGKILDKYPTTKRYETKEYLTQGKYPIVDQGDVYIVGFTNECDNLLTRYPAVLFGDHSTKVKLLDFAFARGADGTQILYSNNPNVSQYYLYLSVLSLQIPNPGYSRHFKYLKELPIIIPDKRTVDIFTDNVTPMFKQRKENIFSNITLAKQRDELLPLLMNGQVTVNPDLSVFTENVILEFFVYICRTKPNIFNNMTKQETDMHTSEENQMKSEEENCAENSPNFLNLKNIAICAGVILGILIIYYLSVYGCIGTSTGANGGSDLSMGTFGDTFGAANALFSGLAFAGMIIALHQQKVELEMQREVLNLQRKDLKLQIQELTNTNAALDGQKEEMANQKKELEQQKKIMAEQLKLAGISQVESTLFYMLGQHNNILNSLSYEIPNGNSVTKKGIDYINYLNDSVVGPNQVYYLNESERINVFPYINNLMQIFKYIDETEVLKSDDIDDEFEKRHKYCSMVTSSLSNNELILIEYYLSIYTGIELNRLCNIYALLENRKYPDERKPNGANYNLNEAKQYFKIDRERKKKEEGRK